MTAHEAATQATGLLSSTWRSFLLTLADPRSWTENAYPKLIHCNRLPKGGYFAAWEQSQFFSDELRASFRLLGGFMTDQQRHEPLTQSPPGYTEPVTTAPVKWRQERWDQGQEKEWEARLRNLQQYICELLIKNQQLRELLESTTNRQYQEFDDEYDQNIARN